MEQKEKDHTRPLEGLQGPRIKGSITPFREWQQAFTHITRTLTRDCYKKKKRKKAKSAPIVKKVTFKKNEN